MRAPRSPASATRRKQNLRRRAGVGSARWQGSAARAEKHGKRSQARALDPAAQQPACEHHRVDGGRSEPAARVGAELVVDERKVEPEVVPGEDGRGARTRRGDGVRVPANVRSRGYLELAQNDFAAFDEHRADLADPRLTRDEARRLEVDDCEASPPRAGPTQPERARGVPRPPPRATWRPRPTTSSSSARASAETGPGQREQDARGFASRESSALLDGPHEPIGAVETGQHAAQSSEHMFARLAEPADVQGPRDAALGERLRETREP